MGREERGQRPAALARFVLIHQQDELQQAGRGGQPGHGTHMHFLRQGRAQGMIAQLKRRERIVPVLRVVGHVFAPPDRLLV